VLANPRTSLVIVCRVDRSIAGVISKTDVVRRIADHPESVSATVAADVMTRDVVSCRSTDALQDVLSLMKDRGLVHVPVIDDRSGASGVLDARDALRALVARAKNKTSLLRDYIMGVGYR
jgi:CBS domain-containing protein